MATVTGLTAERMIEMEEATVIDGEIQGNDLVLITRGGTQINAGNVRGPVGPQGPAVPAGIITATIRDTPDTGFLFLDGATIANAQTLYPPLWAVVPASWKSGSSIIFPDARGKMLVGDDATLTLGALTGSAALTIASANLPPHIHAINHDHPSTAVAISDPQHNHGQTAHAHYVYQDASLNNIQYQYVTNSNSGTYYNAFVLNGSGGTAINLWAGGNTANINPAYTGITASVDLPNFTGSSGDGAFVNTPLTIPKPPSLVINWQIKT